MPLDNKSRMRLKRAKRAAIAEVVKISRAPVADADAPTLLHNIRIYGAALGLPPADADWFYKKMLRDDWKVSGVPVDDWRATMEIFFRAKYFPSFYNSACINLKKG
jgi:hypothetical protein